MLRGEATGSGHGIYGTATSGNGVFGSSATNSSVRGVKTATQTGRVADFVNSNSSNATAALYAETNGTGAAIYALSSNTGVGIFGNSPNGYAVYGISLNSNGVRASSETGSAIYAAKTGTQTGHAGEFVNGNSANSFSALRASTNSNLNAAVEGQNSSNGYGVYGNSMGSGWGVYGASSSGVGVYGSSSTGNSGAFVNSNTGNSVAALYAETAGSGAAITGVSGSNSSVAMMLQEGHLVASGTTPGLSAVGVNVTSSINGTSNDVAGKITVTLGALTGAVVGGVNITFAKTYAIAPVVIIVPTNSAAQSSNLYISNTTTTGFTVDGDLINASLITKTITFNYIVIGVQ